MYAAAPFAIASALAIVGCYTFRGVCFFIQGEIAQFPFGGLSWAMLSAFFPLIAAVYIAIGVNGVSLKLEDRATYFWCGWAVLAKQSKMLMQYAKFRQRKRKYYCGTHWGRVGENGQNAALGPFASPDGAISEFKVRKLRGDIGAPSGRRSLDTTP